MAPLKTELGAASSKARPRLARASVFGLAFLAALAVFRPLLVTSPTQDLAGPLVEQLSAIRSLVKPGERIGFRTERPVRLDALVSREIVLYYVSQYAMAPAVLELACRGPRILAVARDDEALERVIREIGNCSIVSHPRPGLALLERAAPGS